MLFADSLSVIFWYQLVHCCTRLAFAAPTPSRRNMAGEESEKPENIWSNPSSFLSPFFQPGGLLATTVNPAVAEAKKSTAAFNFLDFLNGFGLPSSSSSIDGQPSIFGRQELFTQPPAAPPNPFGNLFGGINLFGGGPGAPTLTLFGGPSAGQNGNAIGDFIGKQVTSVVQALIKDTKIDTFHDKTVFGFDKIFSGISEIVRPFQTFGQHDAAHTSTAAAPPIVTPPEVSTPTTTTVVTVVPPEVKAPPVAAIIAAPAVIVLEAAPPHTPPPISSAPTLMTFENANGAPPVPVEFALDEGHFAQTLNSEFDLKLPPALSSVLMSALLNETLSNSTVNRTFESSWLTTTKIPDTSLDSTTTTTRRDSTTLSTRRSPSTTTKIDIANKIQDFGVIASFLVDLVKEKGGVQSLLSLINDPNVRDEFFAHPGRRR